MLTTFFDGEIISKKYPFLTRKWDADEDVDRKHWVNFGHGERVQTTYFSNVRLSNYRANFQRSRKTMRKHSIRIISIMIV